MTRFCHHLSTDIFPSIQALMQPLPDEIAGKGTGFRHQIKSAMLGRGTRSETVARWIGSGPVAAQTTPLRANLRYLIRESDRCPLLRNPATDIFGAPDGHSLRELAPPEGRFGNGNKSQDLGLTQEPGLGQRQGRSRHDWRSRKRVGSRRRSGDPGTGFGHDRTLLQLTLLKDMTCSVVAALGQDGASR